MCLLFPYHFWFQFCGKIMNGFHQDCYGRQDEDNPKDNTRSGKHTHAQVHSVTHNINSTDAFFNSRSNSRLVLESVNKTRL